MCTLGHEFGSVTGRKRRCGWIDLVALKYSVMINGVTKLIMMKSDVLDTFETIKACVAYKVNGEEIDYFPYDITEGVEPVYAELPGWQTDMTKMQSEDEFPERIQRISDFPRRTTWRTNQDCIRRTGQSADYRTLYGRITFVLLYFGKAEIGQTPPFLFKSLLLSMDTNNKCLMKTRFISFLFITRHELWGFLPSLPISRQKKT